MLCDDLEGGVWGRGGRLKREEKYIYMCVCVCVCVIMTDLCCCMAETNTVLKINFPLYK